MKKKYICTVLWPSQVGYPTGYRDVNPRHFLKESASCAGFLHYKKKEKDSMGHTILLKMKKPFTKVSKKSVCHNCRFLKVKGK